MRKLLSALTATVAVAAATVFSVTGAAAQAYPARPVTMIVPFPPGGGSDILARLLAEHMRASLGQPVIIENVGGAGGTIGVGRLYRAAPDGYTIGFGQWTSHVGAGAIYALPFDLIKDFEPVARLTTAVLWIIGGNKVPANNLKELIAWLKANPGKATAGTIGVGSGTQLCLIDLQNATGTRMQFVPYRGMAPALQDLLAGQIDLTCPEAGQTLALYRSGKIKAYAVMSKSRWFAAPEVPTTDEAGAPGLHMDFWYGLWAPGGTPKDIIARLNAAVVDAFANPEVKERLAQQGQVIPPRDELTPAALGAFHKAEIEKWWPIIKAAGIKAE
jgi:tripartite-type tricarboxylate transporter receptor subunit TctC